MLALLMLLISGPPDPDVGRQEMILMRPVDRGAFQFFPGWDEDIDGVQEVLHLPKGRPLTARDVARLERRHPGHRLGAAVWLGGSKWGVELQPQR